MKPTVRSSTTRNTERSKQRAAIRAVRSPRKVLKMSTATRQRLMEEARLAQQARWTEYCENLPAGARVDMAEATRFVLADV